MKTMLEKYEEENALKLEVSFFPNGETLLKEYDKQTDLIFLDIDMGIPNGIETAKIIRQSNEDVFIIFITNLVHRAIEGYSVRAFGFVGKPLNYSELSYQMDDVIRHIQRRTREKKRIGLKVGADTYQLAASDIIYCEVRKHDLYIHTKNGSLKTRGSMKELEEQLESYGFLRSHASFLVNIKKVIRVGFEYVELKGGISVPLSQKKRKNFMSEITQQLGEHL